MNKFPVRLPDDLKATLEKIARETDLSQATLIKLATYSLVANYKAKGSFIFVDLLNPDRNESKGESITKLPVRLPDDLKIELEEMARETDISQATLIKLATYSLVANYKAKASLIFIDLLNPAHKELR